MLAALSSLSLGLVRHFKAGGVVINEHVLSREETRRHVEIFGRWFDFIHLRDLPGRLNRRYKKPFCLLTFDDGKRNNVTVVAPELVRLGVPAVFFVVSSALDHGTPFWFDRYDALRRKLEALPFGLQPHVVKQLPHAMLTERVERACLQHGIELDLQDDNIRPMTWEDARSLHRRGFTIGAHGTTHAIMTRETKPDACANISKSIARVREQTGEPCSSFAFPNGNYTADLARHAIRCGVQTVMTTEPTWMDHTFPLWRVPRLQFFGTDSQTLIELKTAVAATGRILANPDGTGRAYCAINRLARTRSKDPREPLRNGKVGAAEAKF